MAKLENTSGTAIAITFLVMNLSTWLRRVFCVFYVKNRKSHLFTGQLLSKTLTGQVIENKKLCWAELESPINCERDFS